MDNETREIISQEFEKILIQSMNKEKQQVEKSNLWEQTPDIMFSILIDDGKKIFKEIMCQKKQTLNATDVEIETFLDNLVHVMKIKYVSYYRSLI